MAKANDKPDVLVYLKEMESRLSKSIENSENTLRNKISAAEARINKNTDNKIATAEARINKNTDSKISAAEARIKEYVHDGTDKVVDGVDRMFDEKEAQDAKRHEEIKGEIAIARIERRELKRRVDVLESHVGI